MDILEKTLTMLRKHPLCDNCLGRQFALLGYSIENKERGKALKLSLILQASILNLAKNAEGAKRLEVLTVNGFSHEAQETLSHLKKVVAKKDRLKTCFLCEGKFQLLGGLLLHSQLSIQENRADNCIAPCRPASETHLISRTNA